MLIDDFSHQHFADDIGMEAIDGEFRIHDLTAGIIEVRFQVDKIWLIAYPAIDLLELFLPAFV